MAMNGRIRRRSGLVEASDIGLRIAEFAVFFLESTESFTPHRCLTRLQEILAL